MSFWDTFINSLFGRSTSGQLITPTRQKIIQSQKLPAQALPVNNYTYKPKALRIGITPENIAYNEKILSPYFAKYSVQYGIPYGVLRGLCMTESNMGTDPNGHKTRSIGGRGIMQIELASHPTTGRSAYDPEQAIKYSASYLAQLHKQFKSWRTAIVAYNKGQGAVAALIRKYGNNWYAHRHEKRGGDNSYYAKVSQNAGYAYT